MVTSGQVVTSICTECGVPVHFEVGTSQVRCGHCEAGLVVDQGQRLVRLACPGCGGNFYYLDGSMSGRCPYCEASLLALSRDRVLRFVIPPASGAPAEVPDASLVLLPFWHMSGLVYGWDVGNQVRVDVDPRGDVVQTGEGYVPVPTTVRRESGPKKVFRGRVADRTLADPATLAHGVTGLRWRAAIFHMEPFSEEHERLGRVVAPTLAIDDVRERLRDQVFGLGSVPEGMTQLDCQRMDLVSEELALYYYPFWVHRSGDDAPRIWDGVTGDPEHTSTPSKDVPAAGSTTLFDEMRIIELRCESCGGPLLAGNRPTVVSCASCGESWLVASEGLRPFSAFRAAVQEQVSTSGAQGPYREPQPAVGPVVLQTEGAELAWLPFWRVPVRVRFVGQEASSVADLAGRLGVSRPQCTAKAAPPGSPLHYYVAAYGAMRAPRLDHAARDMTRFQPLLEPRPASPAGEVFHCFLGPQDARKLAYAAWIQVLPSSVAVRLRSLRVEPGEPSLWYLPFEERKRELVNLVTGLRYERSTFKGLRH
jgi:predicted RNA-binding Zn-ribbon protein involved in translation (DUF1610 family)